MASTTRPRRSTAELTPTSPGRSRFPSSSPSYAPCCVARLVAPRPRCRSVTYAWIRPLVAVRAARQRSRSRPGDFSVHEFLVRRCGLVVSKSQILDGYGSTSASCRTPAIEHSRHSERSATSIAASCAAEAMIARAGCLPKSQTNPLINLSVGFSISHYSDGSTSQTRGGVAAMTAASDRQLGCSPRSAPGWCWCAGSARTPTPPSRPSPNHPTRPGLTRPTTTGRREWT